MSHSFTAPPKDPQATLDYGMDWSRWLAEDEDIIVQQVTATGDLPITLPRILPGGKEVAWRLSGGAAGQDYFVTVRIDTSSGQRDERTIRVPVRER